MISFAKKITAFFLLALFIYSPFIKVEGNIIKLPQFFLLFYGIIGLPFLLRFYLRNRLFRNTFNTKIVGVLILMLLYIVHNAKDSLIFYVILPGFAAVSGAFVFVELYRRLYRVNFQYKLIIHIFYVGVLHGFIMIMVLVNINISLFILDTFYHSDKAIASWITRSPGILLEGFTKLSVVQTMTFICGISSLLSDRKKNRHGYVRIFFGSLVILVSTIISGKTGFVLFCFGMVVFCWLIITRRRGLIGGKPKIYIMIKLNAIVLFVLVLLLFSSYDNSISGALRNGLEMFVSFQESGTFRTRTTDIIFKQMYYFPDRLATYLIGNGSYRQGISDHNTPTDIGYVQILFGAGMIGIICSFAFYGYLAVKAYKIRRSNYMLASTMVFFCLIVFIVNFKDILLEDMLGFSQVFSICYVLLVLNYKKRVTVHRGHISLKGHLIREPYFQI
jgi:hypothetical protein